MSSSKALSFEKLGEENYPVWKVYMEAMLVRKSLMDIVDGTKVMLMGSLGSKAVIAFRRTQAEAHAEIILCLEPSQLPHARSADPKVIWDELDAVHCSRGFATRLALRRKFLFLTKKTDQPMQSWMPKCAMQLIVCSMLMPRLPRKTSSLFSLKVSHPNSIISLSCSMPLPQVTSLLITSLLAFLMRKHAKGSSANQLLTLLSLPPALATAFRISRASCVRRRGTIKVTAPSVRILHHPPPTLLAYLLKLCMLKIRILHFRI